MRDPVIPEIEARRIPGFLHLDLARRPLDDGYEFVAIMRFEDLDSIKAFMGGDYEIAHVPEEAQAVLCSFDELSAHFEVLDRRAQ